MYDFAKAVLGIIAVVGCLTFWISAARMLYHRIKNQKDKAKKDAWLALIGIGLGAGALTCSIAVAVKQYSYEYNRLQSFAIYSDDCMDGVWSNEISNQADGINKSPELHWEPVEGATRYCIYMVDESADNWMHWMVDSLMEPQIAAGACNPELSGIKGNSQVRGAYIGPYPPSGTHTYTVYVFALKKQAYMPKSVFFNAAGNDMERISEDLNDTPFSNDTNVIAVGKLSATYTAR